MNNIDYQSIRLTLSLLKCPIHAATPTVTIIDNSKIQVECCCEKFTAYLNDQGAELVLQQMLQPVRKF